MILWCRGQLAQLIHIGFLNFGNYFQIYSENTHQKGSQWLTKGFGLKGTTFGCMMADPLHTQQVPRKPKIHRVN